MTAEQGDPELEEIMIAELERVGVDIDTLRRAEREALDHVSELVAQLVEHFEGQRPVVLRTVAALLRTYAQICENEASGSGSA